MAGIRGLGIDDSNELEIEVTIDVDEAELVDGEYRGRVHISREGWLAMGRGWPKEDIIWCRWPVCEEPAAWRVRVKGMVVVRTYNLCHYHDDRISAGLPPDQYVEHREELPGEPE